VRLFLFAFAFAFAVVLPATSATAATGNDLGITVSGPSTLEQVAGGHPVSYGDGNYSVTITNYGSTAATDVVLAVRFGEGLDWDAFDTTFENCTLSSQVVTCHIDTIAAGGHLTRTFAFYPGTVGTWKTMYSVSAAEPDNKQNNNTDVRKVTVIPPTHADLLFSESSKTESGSTDQPVLVFTFVSNAGPADATNVIDTVVLPDGMTFVPNGSGPDCTASGQTVTCALGDQPRGNTNQPVTVYVVASQRGQYTITETLSSDQPDQNAANSTETIYVQVS